MTIADKQSQSLPATGAETHRNERSIRPDRALCKSCLAELQSLNQRRHGYSLISCPTCGPQFSVIRALPLTTDNTTYTAFTSCDDCQEEFSDPHNRRFQQPTIACPTCGPTLQLVDSDGSLTEGDPIVGAVGRILEGEVVAIQGLGGFYLAARADDPAAILRLRNALKQACGSVHGSSIPLPIMCADLETANEVAMLSPRGRDLLASPAAPIVWARKRPWHRLAKGLAEGTHRFGLMIPTTALEHLLFERAVAIGTNNRGRGYKIWVMAPIGGDAGRLVLDAKELLQRLGIGQDSEEIYCDALLLHNLPFTHALEPSAFIDVPQADPLCLRWARGFVPAPLKLPVHAAQNGLAVGPEHHASFAFMQGHQAILSPSLGDLSEPYVWKRYQTMYADLRDLFNFKPAWIAHDQAPLYLTTHWAIREAHTLGIPTLAVQHHHAHAAAVLAEHQRTGPALAVICDGPGHGLDGTDWGGELLQVTLTTCTRLAHLRPLYLPGGDTTSHETWRSGLALLEHAVGGRLPRHPTTRRLVPNDEQRSLIIQLLQTRQNCTRSTSAARYFDGMAALLGLSMENSFAARAALAIEAAADSATHEPGGGAHPSVREFFTLNPGSCLEIDLRPLIREILFRQTRGFAIAELAGLFHEQFARAWYRAVLQLAKQTGLRTVVLGGGVFCNERLLARLQNLLTMSGLEVLRPLRLPPHDGAIAYGQAAIATATFNQ